MFVRKLVEQLEGDFCDETFFKAERQSSSDKEEKLNGKLFKLWHCEDVKGKDCSECSNRTFRRKTPNYFYDTHPEKYA